MVRHSLAEQEAKALRENKVFSVHEEMSASQLLAMGIELEGQQ
jgi:hypothetical protein